MPEPVDLKRHIRDIPDFPKPGILFRDITPLLAEPRALAAAIDGLVAPWRGERLDAIAAIEARGFLFAPPMASLAFSMALDLLARRLAPRQSRWRFRYIKHFLRLIVSKSVDEIALDFTFWFATMASTFPRLRLALSLLTELPIHFSDQWPCARPPVI